MTPPLKIVAGRRLLFVMAVDAEYGVHLRERIEPLFTGIGPVEAAIGVTHALAELAAAGHLPDLVVCLGSAGSAVLEHTGVYQIVSASYRDMDASPLGFEKGRTPLLDLPAEVPLPLRIPGVPEARLSTGAGVISGAAYAGIDADLVEMETFAVLRACQRFGVPLIGLRGISDGCHDLSGLHDWTAYLHIVDEKLAAALDLLFTTLETGHL
ncbi:5'-methylthioadenosine/S-adenosylhomocysteine nucleosidase [Gellertiella hungarica]|uniref:Adenosylhomocysteine nucleosidase n=1 Tax=Gellertiella hungarica TaxID=1572859 RepID=A0A7W6J2U8_9HYPH|nr:5'-methylthioadenosine/S-adenosylhomocysteine nucleosidase [Gellertiella hungarica]MBB4063724.1 adenosylhomocysteine nucleosidase [Gellertiella hungarica]